MGELRPGNTWHDNLHLRINNQRMANEQVVLHYNLARKGAKPWLDKSTCQIKCGVRRLKICRAAFSTPTDQAEIPVRHRASSIRFFIGVIQ